jgi:hypothetical protein
MAIAHIEIPLTQNKLAIVDIDDYKHVANKKWYAKKDKQTFYACRNENIGPRRITVLMHRLITSYAITDHKNGNGLDNRRINLRPVSHSQNKQNSKKTKGTSKYKGVSQKSYKWVAQIRVDGKVLYLGLFKTEELAAIAYNNAATNYFGEYASLNVID